MRLERGIGPLLRLLNLGKTLGKILEHQVQLVAIEPFRAPAEL